MVNNIFELFENVLLILKEKKVSLNVEKKDVYLISSNDLDRILNIFFIEFSSSEYSFTIFREKKNSCTLEFFDYQSNKIKKVIFKSEEESENKFFSIFSSYKQKFFKKAVIVSVLGPDGVGKTTLLQLVLEKTSDKILYKRFKKIVRRSLLYNITYPITRYLLKKKLGFKPEKDQHDDTYPTLIVLCGIFYYPYLIFKSLLQKNFVFVDRFFQDYLLKDISFMKKETTLRENWKSYLTFIPRSSCVIHLDAKEDIILSRKEELSKDDIKKYRELNFIMYLEKPSMLYVYINTGKDIKYCKSVLKYSLKKLDMFKSKND